MLAELLLKHSALGFHAIGVCCLLKLTLCLLALRGSLLLRVVCFVLGLLGQVRCGALGLFGGIRCLCLGVVDRWSSGIGNPAEVRNRYNIAGMTGS